MTASKRDILVAAKAAGLFALARQRSARGVRILCYHGLWLNSDDFPGDSMFMQATTFARRLAMLRREGYPVVTLDHAIAALRGSGPELPPAAVVITIDDGWYSTYRGMLPALEAHGMPATLYCDTAQLMGGRPIAHVMARYLDRIAAVTTPDPRQGAINVAAVADLRRDATNLDRTIDERLGSARHLATALGLDIKPYLQARAFDYMTPDELRDAHSRGLDVQLHTHNHTLGDMSESVIADEIETNRRALAGILGQPAASFNHFCYPSGIADADVARLLGGLGLASSTTTVQGIAQPGMPMHLLPRLLDGENLSDIEFEAELSGFGDWLRRGKHAATRLSGAWRPLFANPAQRHGT